MALRILMICLLFVTKHTCGQNYTWNMENELPKYTSVDFGYSPKKVSFKTRRHLEPFLKAQECEGRYLGRIGMPSELYRKYEESFLIAPQTDLIELCKHPNNVVRYYAFQGLLEQKADTSIILQVIKQHLKDTTYIIIFKGSTKRTLRVGDYMIERAKYGYDLITEEAENVIDSLLFWQPGNAISRRSLTFDNIELTEKSYLRLKELIDIEKDENAILPLFQFKKASDIHEIPRYYAENKEIGLEIMKNHPQENMLDSLIDLQLNTNWEHYKPLYQDMYKAILGLCAESQEKALDELFNLPESDHKKELMRCLTNTLSRIDTSHTALCFKLFERGIPESGAFFNHLWSSDSLLVYSIINYKITNENTFPYAYQYADEMIDKCENYLNTEAATFIANGIWHTSNNQFISHAKNYKDTQVTFALVQTFQPKKCLDYSFYLKYYLELNNEEVYQQIGKKVEDLINDSYSNTELAIKVYKLGMLCDSTYTTDKLLNIISSANTENGSLRAAINVLIDLENEQINQYLIALSRKITDNLAQMERNKIIKNFLIWKGVIPKE